MPPTDHHDDGFEHNEDVAHEHTDVNVRTVLIAALALAVVIGIVQVAMWALFNRFEQQATTSAPPLSPLALPADQQPPEPRLQVNEYAGLKTFREAEAKTLEAYGWIDEKAGVAHVPISEAKKLVAERGLPSRAAAVDPATGTHAQAYGEASGGRNLTRPIRPPGAPAKDGPRPDKTPGAPPHR